MDIKEARPIQLGDKNLFDTYFHNYPPHLSELTFTNLFIWRKHYDFLFMEWRDHLIVFSKTYLTKWKKPWTRTEETLFFLPPIGENPHLIMIELFKELENVEFRRVPEDVCNNLKLTEEFNTLNLEIIEDRDNWDYVYDKQELIELPGNKLRDKRRWLQKFMEKYQYEFSLLTEEWIQPCLKLQLKWCDMNQCQKNEDLLEEQDAIKEALNNYFILDLKGGIICVKGECIAYTIGEKLNEDTAVIHFEKAYVQYEGSYQAINNLFLKNCCTEEIKFINREQDLGIQGMRKAKLSYKPHHMVKKNIIFKKSES